MLEGKEVYGCSPSTVAVVEGDTEDDIGSFVPPDCGVDLPPQRVTHATYVARRAGVYAIVCKVAKHLPMMSAQLVVLPAATMARDES